MCFETDENGCKGTPLTGNMSSNIKSNILLEFTSLLALNKNNSYLFEYEIPAVKLSEDRGLFIYVWGVCRKRKYQTH